MPEHQTCPVPRHLVGSPPNKMADKQAGIIRIKKIED
jgi:hypothetical protein